MLYTFHTKSLILSIVQRGVGLQMCLSNWEMCEQVDWQEGIMSTFATAGAPKPGAQTGQRLWKDSDYQNKSWKTHP